MKRVGLGLLAIIYFPVAFVVALVYGVLMGMLGKTVATIEDARRIIRREIWMWRRYPKRTYDNFIQTLLLKKGMPHPWEEDQIKKELQTDHPRIRFPWTHILFVMYVFILLYPIRLVVGAFRGPFIVFEDWHDFWQFKVLGKPFKSKYIKKYL